nr:hypothetical protein [Tanacetum cinerariifolium]
MRKVGKGFSGVETPLFENMLTVRAIDAEEEVQVPAQDDVVQEHVIEEISTEVVPPTPTSPLPSSPGRISVDMETNEGIEVVVDQEKDAGVEGRQADTQAEIYNIDLYHSSKVLYRSKGILIEDPKPMKKKDQIEMDAEYANKLQEELDKEHGEAYKQIDWNAAFDHVQAKE